MGFLFADNFRFLKKNANKCRFSRINMTNNNDVDVIGWFQMFDLADGGILGVVVVGVDIFNDI